MLESEVLRGLRVRRLVRIVNLWSLACIGVLFLAWVLVESPLTRDGVLLATITFAGILYFATAGYLKLARCPRCHEPFSRELSPIIWITHQVATECDNCGVSLGCVPLMQSNSSLQRDRER